VRATRAGEEIVWSAWRHAAAVDYFPKESATHCESRPQWNTTFDGDTASFNVNMTDEAIAEVSKYLTTKNAFVSPHNGLRASASVPTVELVLKNMTG
jgi:hypothetical protein